MIQLYIALAIAVVSFGAGWKVESWRWDSAEKVVIEKTHTEYVNRDILKEKIVTKYVDKIGPVQEITREVTHEAQAMVPSPSCPTVPNRLVELHDSAAASQHPGPASSTDGAPSEVTPSQVAETVGENYGIYNKLSAQVIGLQEYVREVCQKPSS